MITDTAPLVEALQAHKCITLQYTKENGEQVTHTGGITEIGINKKGNQVLWLWDNTLNDHIRQFLFNGIMSFQVLDQEYVDAFGWGFKLNGEIIP
jgi:hypothetical protein